MDGNAVSRSFLLQPPSPLETGDIPACPWLRWQHQGSPPWAN